jgi:hypothetical protein
MISQGLTRKGVDRGAKDEVLRLLQTPPRLSAGAEVQCLLGTPPQSPPQSTTKDA